VIGVTAGVVHGCCGWGGAQIIKPALISGLGLNTLAANGASLTALAFGSTTGASKFFASDSANIKISLAIALPSVIGARLGVRLAQKLSNDALSLIFNGMSVLFIPMHFFVQKYKETRISTGQSQSSEDDGPEALMKHIIYGGFMGTISSLMGVGGAPLTMSYLTLATDLPHHKIQGTMMIAIVPAVVTSATTLIYSGHVPIAVAAAVCAGSITGSYFGAELALRLSEKQLRDCYMASLVVLGGRSIFGAAGNLSKLMKNYISSSKR